MFTAISHRYLKDRLDNAELVNALAAYSTLHKVAVGEIIFFTLTSLGALLAQRYGWIDKHFFISRDVYLIIILTTATNAVCAETRIVYSGKNIEERKLQAVRAHSRPPPQSEVRIEDPDHSKAIIESLTSANQRLAQELDVLKQELSDLRKRFNEEAEAMDATYQDRITRKDQEIAALRKVAEESQVLREAAEKESQELREDSEKESQSLSFTNTSLKADLQLSEKTKQDVSSQLAQQKQLNERLKKEIETTKGQIEELKERVEELKERVEEQGAELDKRREFERQNATLNEQNKYIKEELVALGESSRKTTEQNNLLFQNNQAMKTQLVEALLKLRQVEQTLAYRVDQEQKLQQAQEANELLQIRVKAYKRELTEFIEKQSQQPKIMFPAAEQREQPARAVERAAVEALPPVILIDEGEPEHVEVQLSPLLSLITEINGKPLESKGGTVQLAGFTWDEISKHCLGKHLSQQDKQLLLFEVIIPTMVLQDRGYDLPLAAKENKELCLQGEGGEQVDTEITAANINICQAIHAFISSKENCAQLLTFLGQYQKHEILGQRNLSDDEQQIAAFVDLINNEGE